MCAVVDLGLVRAEKTLRLADDRDFRAGRRRGGGEVPSRVIGDSGERVVGQVLDRAGVDPDGKVRVSGEVCRRVDRQDRTAERDLGCVGDRDDPLGRVAEIPDRDVSAAEGDGFVEGQNEIGSDRHAGGVVGRAQAGDGGCGGIGCQRREIPSRVIDNPGECVVGQVFERAGNDLDGISLAAREICRRVDCQKRAVDGNLAGVGDRDDGLRRVRSDS